jgi:hypothetical protein
MASPTSRTLAWFRSQGYAAEVVERWIARAEIRRDLFHCIDVVAIKAGEAIIGVQATSAPNVSARINKARRIGDLKTWLAAGGRFLVIGWTNRTGQWSTRIEEIKLDDMGDVEVQTVVKVPRKRPRSRWQAGDLFEGLQELTTEKFPPPKGVSA